MPARASEADVTDLLASQPAPEMPEHLVARVSDAIAAESARSFGSSPSGRSGGDRQTPRASAPTLPQPRSGKPWPLFEMIVPRPRKAHSAA